MGLKASSEIQQNELTMIDFLLILLLISSTAFIYTCVHTHVHKYISKHQEIESIKPLFFLPLKGKKII